MIRQVTAIAILLLTAGSLTGQNFNNASPVSLKGYVKDMGGMRLDKDFSDAHFDNLLHNRLNFRWNISQDFTFVTEGRNRIFYNPLLKNFPIYADMLKDDPGLMDLSWVWMNEGEWVGHSMLDRLYLDYSSENWRVRVGRQRINWGVTMVSNPNDLFNTYSFFDFDYPERPGADAVRIQRHLGFASRIEVAYSPAKDSKESTGAILYTNNYNGYDIQGIAGYYRNRLALGAGWAGNIGGAGFKGEGTWFYDLEEIPGISRGNVVASVGLDYMFGSGTFAILEFLYNGGHGRTDDGVFLLTQPLRPDNIMFSEFAVTLSANHPFSSVLQGGLALMALPDAEAAFIMPNINYSLLTNLDLEILAQIFAGGKRNTIFEEAGSYWVLSMKYSF